MVGEPPFTSFVFIGAMITRRNFMKRSIFNQGEHQTCNRLYFFATFLAENQDGHIAIKQMQTDLQNWQR
jgi:hypothetical protein